MIYSESCQPRILYHLSIIKEKDIPRQTKTEDVHHYICLTRCAEGIPLNWNEKLLNHNVTACENTNLSGKTKHVYSTGYYHQSLKTLIERSQP